MDIDIRKIGGARPPSPSQATSPSGASAGGVTADSGVKENSGVSVQLTDTASLLKSTEATLAQSPVIDPAKVAALKDAIASGRYHVDASRVAAKFLSLEPSL